MSHASGRHSQGADQYDQTHADHHDSDSHGHGRGHHEDTCEISLKYLVRSTRPFTVENTLRS